MLQAYAVQRGGLIFAEVPIGGPRGLGEWPADCTVRRLDGVRVGDGHRKGRVIRWNRSMKEEFLRAIHGAAAVELIEVKPSLNRSAIGQMVAGRAMFGRQYRVTVDLSVIVCAHGDAALEWVCGQEGIAVELLHLRR